ISGDGDYVISGAPFDDEKDTNTGCAYVYSRAGSAWSLATTLYPSIVDTNIRAGVSVAISNDGNYFAMGVPLDDVAGLNTGCVYIYNRIGSVLTQQTILYPSITTGESQMGEAVSFNPTGQYLLCGAPLEDTVNTNAGSV